MYNSRAFILFESPLFFMCRYILIYSFIFFLFLFNACSLQGTDFQKSFESNTDTDVLMLFYMDGDNDLNDAIFLDLNEVEKGLASVYTPDGNIFDGCSEIKAVALWDGGRKQSNGNTMFGKAGSYLYEIGPEFSLSNKAQYTLSENTKDVSLTASWLKSGEVNMGSITTLVNFLNWATERYTYKKLVLVISNHGGGPGNSTISNSARIICVDQSAGSKNNCLSTQDVSYAFKLAGFGGVKGKIDLLFFDLCNDCSVEEAYEYKDYADYMVASPNLMPGSGYDYTRFAPLFLKNNTIRQTGINIVKQFASYYDKVLSVKTGDDIAANYNADKYVNPTLSLIDLSKIDNVTECLNGFSDELLKNFDADVFNKMLENPKTVKENNGDSVTFNSAVFYTGTYTYLYDIGYVMDYYKQDSSLKVLCDSVIDSLNEAIVIAWRDDFTTSGFDNNFYVNTLKDTTGYHGLTVTAKFTGTTIDKSVYQSFYDHISFGQDCLWQKILKKRWTNDE